APSPARRLNLWTARRRVRQRADDVRDIDARRLRDECSLNTSQQLELVAAIDALRDMRDNHGARRHVETLVQQVRQSVADIPVRARRRFSARRRSMSKRRSIVKSHVRKELSPRKVSIDENARTNVS